MIVVILFIFLLIVSSVTGGVVYYFSLQKKKKKEQKKKKAYDCVGSFGAWSDCSAVACGTEGTEQRTFNVTSKAANGGSPCEYTRGHVEERKCEAAACGTKIKIEHIPQPKPKPTVYYKYESRDFPLTNIAGSTDISGSLFQHLKKCDKLSDCGSFARWKTGDESRRRAWFKPSKSGASASSGVVDLYSKTNLHVPGVTPKVIKRDPTTGIVREDSCWPEWDFSKQQWDCSAPKNKTFRRYSNKRYAKNGWGGYGLSVDKCKDLCKEYEKDGNGMEKEAGCSGFYMDKSSNLCFMTSDTDIGTNMTDSNTHDLYVMKDA